ncbi:hypothetical protein NQ314_009237 [Rhamnusium bicolor]|uniref:DDE Tnp4 domain-containing protein n=1 Tax=Rhamnusium bicolor TaxID=1586634 RepID=A0AAV8Y4D3_9CUCU|nr:hypothetical protein NQ314_009237 [Rhamnusium bicolor]
MNPRISSTDSSSDDDLEVRGPMGKHKLPRVEEFIEKVVDSYTDEECRNNFRMNRRTFSAVLTLIAVKISTRDMDVGRHTIPAKAQLLIALWYFATPDSYRSICGRFNIGKATGLRTVRRVANALFDISPTIIKWPTGDERERVIEQFQLKGFPSTIGAIDGTHSDTTTKRSWIHRIIARSEEDFPNNVHIIGNKAYPCLPQLQTPYKDNGRLTVAQKNYNFQLSKARTTIERAFALLKKRFRCLIFVVCGNGFLNVEEIINNENIADEVENFEREFLQLGAN